MARTTKHLASLSRCARLKKAVRTVARWRRNYRDSRAWTRKPPRSLKALLDMMCTASADGESLPTKPSAKLLRGPWTAESVEPDEKRGREANARNGTFPPIADIRVCSHPSSMTELLCIVCPHVFADERPVRVLIHHYDGSWQAVCGEHEHRKDCSDFQGVGLNHIFDRQPELRQFEGLPSSSIAEKTAEGWQVARLDE